MMRGIDKFGLQIYVDAGVSGGMPFARRPAGADLLAAARKGDIVIASKLDRMFRNSLDALATAERFKEQGIHLVLFDLGQDPLTSDGMAKLVEYCEELHPDDASRANVLLDAHLRGATPSYEAEYRLRHKSGRWVWILDKGRVIERDDAGKPLRACGTHLDITERKETEARLEQAKEEAEQMSRELMEATARAR